MLPAPRSDLEPNTTDYERLALVKPTGFREYDARTYLHERSPVSEEMMQAVLKAIELELSRHPEVGRLAWH